MLLLHIGLALMLAVWTICGGVYVRKCVKNTKNDRDGEPYENMTKHNDKY